MSRLVGWRVHGWAWPIIWWARRKPHSDLRQWIWLQVDAIKWRGAMRHYRKLQRMSDAEIAAHLNKRWRA